MNKKQVFKVVEVQTESYLIINEKQYLFAIRLQDVKKIIDCSALNLYQIPGKTTRWMAKAEDYLIQILSINFLQRSPLPSDRLIIMDSGDGDFISFVVEKVSDIERCQPSDLVIKSKAGLAVLLTRKNIV